MTLDSAPATPDRLGGPPPANEDLVGLALSGGGVRSATFGLGALQALERLRLLRLFDYMSTVSGGGFVGGWWSAWLSRSTRQPTDVFPDDEELEPARKPPRLLSGAPGGTPPPGLPDGALSAQREDPIHHLRLFASYLTPRRGALSADTWRGVAFYARTLLLTWLALLPLLLGAILLAQLYYVGGWARELGSKRSAAAVATDFVCARPDAVDPPAKPAAVATGAAAKGASATLAAATPAVVPKPRPRTIEAAVCATAVARLHGSALWDRVAYVAIPVILLSGIMVVLLLLWVLHSTEAPAAAFVGMLGAAVIVIPLVRLFLPAEGAQLSRLLIAVLVVGALTTLIHLGMMARVDLFRRIDLATWGISHDVHRARLARWHARLMRLTVVLGVLLIIAGFGHEVVWYFFDADGGALPAAARKAGGGGALLLALASAAFTGYKALPTARAQDSAESLSLASRAVIRLAPYVVVLVLAILLAALGHWVIARWAWQPPDALRLSQLVVLASLLQLGFALYEWTRDLLKYGSDWSFVQWLTGVTAVMASLAGALGLGLALHAWHWVSPAVDDIKALATCSAMGLAFCSVFILVESVRRILGGRGWRLAGFALQTLNGRAALLAFLAWLGFAYQLSFAHLGPPVATSSALQVLPWALGELIVLTGAWVVGIGWMADPNLLSMHAFYEARLVRAYLGASNRGRGTEITDTAPGDDVPLRDLWNHDQGMPYHLINTTLNLVGAPDLATSQRYAANFVLSKYYCGSSRTGYQRTHEYMDGALTLGAAVAISGAAASPNMGSKNPGAALAALLALLNVRLGFWAPNPGRNRWRERQARLWPFYLVYEFLSQTNDSGTYCYLTDGGHFDNTGLYALVERGCRYIVVLDCGADPSQEFEDIGQAIRRCRIDFGAEIELEVAGFLERDPNEKNEKRLRRRHVVVGDIVYSEEHWQMLGLPPAPNDADRTGRIVWIKPTVVGDDSADVRQYHRQNRAYPQQTTLNQWYDEAQFEAYRKLGYTSVLAAFEGPRAVPAPGDRIGIRNYFQFLTVP